MPARRVRTIAENSGLAEPRSPNTLILLELCGAQALSSSTFHYPFSIELDSLKITVRNMKKQ